MGLMDTLFGSGPSLEQASTLTPEQNALLSQLMGVLGGQLGQGIPGYEGQITPGASPLQQMLFGKAGDWLGRAGEGGREYWETAVKAPAMEMWESEVLPTIREQYIGQGLQSSSALNRAFAESGQKLTTGLAGTLADVLFKEQQALPGQMGTLMGIGGTERGIQRELLQEPYMKWQMTQPWANPWLQQMGLGLGTKAFENVVMPGTEGLMGPLMQAAGGALGGFLGGPAFGAGGAGFGALTKGIK